MKVRDSDNRAIATAHLEVDSVQNTRMTLKLYHAVLLLLSNGCPLHGRERVKLQCTSPALEALLFLHLNLCKDRVATLTLALLGIKVQCPNASI